MADTDGKYGFGVTLTDESVKRVADEVKKEFQGMSQSAATEGAKMENSFKKIGAMIGVSFSVKAATDFAKQIVNVRGEIESLEVSFRTLLGSEQKATALMADIRKFASSTPMQLDDLASGAQTLLAFNIEAEKVMPILQALGDVSMGDSQKFQGLTLAFSQMSSAGKLMGQDLMQMINAGFNPLAQISESTGKSIGQLKDEMSQGKITVDMVTQAFMDATSEGGKFHNMLEQQSKGIQGSLSNLQGAVQDMMNDMGEKIQDTAVGGVQALTALVQNYETVGRVIGTLVATYGAYKAAVMAVTAAQSVATAVSKGYTIANQLEYVWLLLVEKAQKMLNATMLSNPFVLVATAVIGLVSAFVLLNKKTDESKRRTELLNGAVEKIKDSYTQAKNSIEEYISTLESEDSTAGEKKSAYESIAALLPNYLKGLGNEAEKEKAINELLKDRKRLKEALEDETAASSQSQAQSYADDLDKIKEYEELITTYRNAQKEVAKDVSNPKRQTQLGELGNEIVKYQQLRDAILATYKDAAKEAGYSSRETKKYLEEVARSSRKAAAEYQNSLREARFNDKPIEQRIEITESSIKTAESRLAAAKAKAEAEPWNPVLRLDLSLAEQDLERLKTLLNNLYGEKKDPIKVDFAKEVRDAEAALRKAREAYRKDATEANKTAVTNAEATVDTKKKNYKAATGKDYDQAIKDAKDRRKQQKELDEAEKKEREEYAKWIVKQAQQAEFDRRQAEVDAMKEGLSKTLKQIELDYDQQLAAVKEREEEMIERLRDLKEKEWEAANPTKKKAGEKFDRSSVTSADLAPEKQQQLTDQSTRALEQRTRKEKAAMEEMLKEVQTYQQKRLAIIKEYQQREEELYDHDDQGNRTGLRQGVTQANVNENSRQQNNALENLDAEFAQRQDTYQAWLNQIASWTYSQLVEVLEAAQIELKQAESDFGVNSEEAAALRQKVKDLTNEMKMMKANGEVAGSKLKQKFNELKPSLEKVGGQIESIGDAISGFGTKSARAAGQTISALGTISKNAISIFDSITTLTQGTTAAIQTATTGATTAMETAAVGAAGAIRAVETASVILAVIGAALGIAQQIYSLFSGNAQKKHEEALKAIENEIEDIDDAYDELDKTAQKTFGASNAEIRKQQQELKKAQIELLKTAIAEEKAQKDPDNDKIREWSKQIQKLEGEIAELGETAVDAIFGEDITTAIENFAEGLADAWTDGASAADSATNSVKRMMKQMVQEAIKDSIQASGAMQAIRQKLQEFWDDEYFSDEEKAELERMANELQDRIEEQFGWANDLFDESSREGSKKGIATASQESVDENNGRLTAIQGSVSHIKEHTSIISDNSNIIRDTVTAIYGSVQRIEYNTEELHTIRATLNDIQTLGVKIRS